MQKLEEDLVIENQALIGYAIKQMHLTWKTDDEYQEYFDAGLEGLIKGIKNFDYSTGNALSSFLLPCIKNEIKRFLYIKTMPKRYNPKGKDFSLEYLLFEGDENTRLIDKIADPKVNVEEEIIRKEKYEQILDAINHIKYEQDKLIIKMNYGLDGYKEKSVEAIAKDLKISRSLAYRKKTRGIESIKKYIEKNYC